MVGLLWIVNISFAEINISGNVSGTWTVANSPYIATNNQGEPVSAGVYLYKVQAGDFVDTKKMILLK
tara:strand:+ start:464 stop:664 length:201 start_codon:yes stop_codon:yes gene_type:complete